MVENRAGTQQRFFKTAWFSKASAKAHITDGELCIAIQQVMLGQCDDLGGGVYKKRLSKNLARSIILAKGGRYWVYEYLFAKKDLANIDNDDLVQFRKLAKNYEQLTEEQVSKLLQNRKWMEICDDHES
jgi:hypothetical protein